MMIMKHYKSRKHEGDQNKVIITIGDLRNSGARAPWILIPACKNISFKYDKKDQQTIVKMKTAPVAINKSLASFMIHPPFIIILSEHQRRLAGNNTIVKD